jgi:hypothetical protein
LKLGEKCLKGDDDGDADMKSEVCFEFPDVGKVKQELDDKEVQEASCAQNKEENNEEQEENMPEMGFVQ